jgi:DNA-binding transcriptional ArsR family regulator
MSPPRLPSDLTDPQRVRALASPVRIEIIEALQIHGPATVAEIARSLGRRPDSLYHHLRRLEAAGIVEECERRTEGGRAARVLRVVEEMAEAGLGPQASPDLRRAVAEIAVAILRLGEREVRKAAMAPQVRTEGKRRNLHTARQKVWLAPGDLERLNGELDDLRERYAAHERGEDSELFALTTILLPLEQKDGSGAPPPGRPPTRKASSPHRRRSSKRTGA